MNSVRPDYDVDAWRRQIPLLASCIPMNNCSQAPQTDATRAAALRYLDSWNRRGMDWEAWLAEVALAKAAFATLIGATPSDIAVFSSVSEAASAVASALDFSGRRSGIVVSEAEFPSVAPRVARPTAARRDRIVRTCVPRGHRPGRVRRADR